MPANVSLRSLMFSYSHHSGGAFSAIKCTLTDDQQSPLFTLDGEERHHTKVINFPGNNKVAKVQAYDGNESAYTLSLGFTDKYGVLIDSFMPNPDYPPNQVAHFIAENEELIGVYGVKDKIVYFSSFGFIVKVRHQ